MLKSLFLVRVAIILFQTSEIVFHPFEGAWGKFSDHLGSYGNQNMVTSLVFVSFCALWFNVGFGRIIVFFFHAGWVLPNLLLCAIYGASREEAKEYQSEKSATYRVTEMEDKDRSRSGGVQGSLTRQPMEP